MTYRIAALFGALSLGFGTLTAPSALTTAALAQEAYQPLPLEEYGKLPDVEDVAISPSGDRIAMITTVNGQRALLAIEDQSKSLRAIALDDRKVRSMRWIGEDRVMLVTSQTEKMGAEFADRIGEFSIAQVIPITAKGSPEYIFGNSQRYANTILGVYGIREIDGTYYGYFGAMELERGNTRSRTAGFSLKDTSRHLMRVNLETMETLKVAAAAQPGYWRDWILDSNGEIAYTMEWSYQGGRWEIRNAEGREIVEGFDKDADMGLVGLGRDGSSAIYYVSGEEEGESEWYEIDAAGGEPRKLLPEVDFEGLFFDGKSGALKGYVIGESDEEEEIHFIDDALQSKWERVRDAFSDFHSSVQGWTSDLGDVIIRTSGNQDSGTYYAIDLSTSRANAIAYERIALTPEHVGPISTFEYTASDGTELSGILTLPPGREPKNLPLVLLPHGGPHSADSATFDWWAQAYASRGYAVFQPNFRGSTNRDLEFRRAGYGEWGRKMQTDKTDGMIALAEAGIVDPNRACIVGASYGGYAALAGVTVQQDMFKCAVAVAPVSDIRDIYNEGYRSSGGSRLSREGLRRQLGEPELWDPVSPLKLADRADAPILLIHGKDDTVVAYSHSTKMADRLKDAGKPYEFVTLEGEDHWLSLSETRQQMLKAAVRFVEKHNPAD